MEPSGGGGKSPPVGGRMRDILKTGGRAILKLVWGPEWEGGYNKKEKLVGRKGGQPRTYSIRK